MTQILLIGAGGVGAIVAYGLVHAGKANVSIVVRRDYDKVTKEGYKIKSVDYGEVEGWKPDHIYPTVEAAAVTEYDYVIITTKVLPEVTKNEELVEPVVTPGKTAIVLIQNGFDIGRPFIAKYPKNVVLSGVTRIGSHNHNGSIVQTQQDNVIIAPFENKNLDTETQTTTAKHFVDIYNNGKNKVVFAESAKFARYSKLVYNASFNTICTLTGVDTGRLENSGTLELVALPAMREVVAVAKADGVDLDKDCINEAVHSDDGDYFLPSMLVDYRKGNPLELEGILGNLLVVAGELEVPTPTLTLVYNLLKAVQYGLLEKNGVFTIPEKRPITDRYFE